MHLGVLDHLIDIFVAETAGRLDANLLLLAGTLVLGRHVDDAVRVDIEGDVDLRQAARRRGNTDQVELTQHLVVGRHLPFALEDPDGHGGLVVFRRREDLALLRRDRRVAVDEAREYAAQSLDAERQGRHVEQQHVLDVALQYAGLDRRADGDHFVRIDATMRVASEEFLHRLNDLRHAGHAAYEYDLVDFAGLQPGVLERLPARIDRPLDQIVDQRFELGARQLHVEMLGTALIGGDERQVHLRRHRAGQFDLRLLGLFLEPLQRELVAAQVDALLPFELIAQVFDDSLVEILAAEECVAVRRFHFEDAVADLEDRDIERAAAEVVDGDRADGFLLEPVGERRGGRFVDDA